MKATGVGQIGSLAPDKIQKDLKNLDPSQGGAFKEALSKANDNKKSQEVAKAQPLTFKFSNHAVERMQRRGISYSPEQLQSIERAVAEAEKKGSKEALILSDESAMIVSVKNKTVVTVMDKESLKDNVFTNIDSTVII